jgi:hypothetical protein
MLHKYALLVLTVGTMLLAIYTNTFAYSEAKITLEVLGEDGLPVTGAKSGVTYQLPKRTEQGVNFVTIQGYTDAGGIFAASHESMFRDIAFGAEKEGYYKSQGVYEYRNDEGGRWLPWNPNVSLVLRKRENPVPMYARDTHISDLRIPIVGKEVGLDLIEFDWMPPYGKGKYADFIFRMDSKYVSGDDFESTLTLTFMGKQDGIQLIKDNRKGGSSFKLPRFAPKTGYKNILVKKIKKIPGKSTEDDIEHENNYIFRIRSEERDGKLLRAMYGKIQGDIEVHPYGTKSGRIYFMYYLNPDHTRNLEYGTNLFRNLKVGEEPGLGK